MHGRVKRHLDLRTSGRHAADGRVDADAAVVDGEDADLAANVVEGARTKHDDVCGCPATQTGGVLVAAAAVMDVLRHIAEELPRPLLPGAEVINVLEHSQGEGLETLPRVGDVAVGVAVGDARQIADAIPLVLVDTVCCHAPVEVLD